MVRRAGHVELSINFTCTYYSELYRHDLTNLLITSKLRVLVVIFVVSEYFFNSIPK